MKQCVIEERNGIPYAVFPIGTKALDWMFSHYGIKDDYLNDEFVIPCRYTDVRITKPIVEQTPMGIIQREQSYVERWLYLDIPYKSLLVNIGEDITSELGLEFKEEELLESRNESIENE